LAELMDAPILLVHVSSPLAAKYIRHAQTRLLPVYGETCPQYLWLLSESLKGDDFEGKVSSPSIMIVTFHNFDPLLLGAKMVCSPPERDKPEEIDALWEGVANGTFTTFSSDHAATKSVIFSNQRHSPIG
jgi:dihydropyrimidinase